MNKWFLLLLLFQLSCYATPQSMVRRAENMRAVLEQADDAYYNKNQPIMSDEAYDALRAEYEQWIEQHPQLTTTPRVGAPVKQERIEHTCPVLSLQKAYSDEAIETFIQKCGQTQRYCVEPKIDGVSLVLYYRHGVLSQALTRGDGKAGMDVTSVVLASGAVPLKLITPQTWIVRGEMFIPITAFNQLNRRRADNKNAPLKSPRNTTAGTLRLLDYGEIARRSLQFLAFELVQADPLPTTHNEALAWMESAGLPVIESRTVRATEVLATVHTVNRIRARYPFQSDGIVIKINNRALFNRLGATSHHPHGALARKYRQKPTITRLLSVDWQRGATGVLTPIAHFEPIAIGGATLQKATLHNEAYIQALDLKIGDWIKVIRAGDTIPAIIGNLPARRTGQEVDIPLPGEYTQTKD